MTGDVEAAIRAKVRADLPPHVFRRRPWRILLGVPLVVAIVGLSSVLATVPLPWALALVGSAIVSQLYVALMFFGHEAAHGAMVRSRRLQDALLCFSLPVFLVSPHLWRHWHNRFHHRYTNIAGIDPDRFGRLEDLASTHPALLWLTQRLAPGSRHWMSAFYLFVAFTLHGQLVLWLRSQKWASSGFRWPRAVLETVAIAVFWLALGVVLGARGAALVILVPMLLANATVMAYITTNHMLRPLTTTSDNLRTSMSVTTHKLIDVVHLHFSYHIEHHLFPALSHRYYPLVRQSLRRHAPVLYLAPVHWRALVTLYSTPRFYCENHVLFDPRSGRRTPISDLEARLRAADPGHAGERALHGTLRGGPTP
jgi:fatty acid desaturase